jgi:hypothetical protein
MNAEMLALIALLLAAMPFGLFLLNLRVYRRTMKSRSPVTSPISVLIPARNEAQNMGATLEAALTNLGCEFEIVVLDDHSTDDTPAIVREVRRHDARVRLEAAPALPVGWCGKQHACHVLSQLARYPLLVFMDADVRLAPDALVRMASFMERGGTDLASGVPRQELGTFSDRLLIPLIHFILLGFLPMHVMRRTRLPSMSAGCGGHAMLRDSLHDGIKLPRVFRQAGFSTGLFDATDIATCRMYRTNLETWRGLGKNATEGLASPGTILPMTGVLIGGQVLPFVLLAFASALSQSAFALAATAATLALIPRLIATRKFRQPLRAALLHPVGILALLGIQWHALACHLAGKPSVWKGRVYSPLAGVESVKPV